MKESHESVDRKEESRSTIKNISGKNIIFEFQKNNKEFFRRHIIETTWKQNQKISLY